jgi:hypothetical protein
MGIAPRRGGLGKEPGRSCYRRPGTSPYHSFVGRQKAGRITAPGMTKEVTFEPVDGPINDRVDDAYRTKYHDSPYLSPMIGARARSATVKVMPRETNV